MIGRETLQKNMAYAENLWRKADCIHLGQLEEVIRIAANEKPLLSPTEAASVYRTAFPNTSLISEKFAAFLQLLWERRLLQPAPLQNTHDAKESYSFLYVPSSYTELACKRFASVIPSLHLSPKTDFQKICETASSEKNSFCILPISSSTEGELPAFARMIHEYQLKTRAVCDVITSDGETELRFALLTGQICWTELTTFAEISFQPESGKQIIDALLAMQRLGAGLYRINARPMEYNMNKFYYKITVNIAQENIHSVAAFIETAFPMGACGAFHII
jgi:prephenate dehydratase